MITVTGSLAFDHIMDYPGKFSDHIMPDKIHQINLSFLVNTLTKQKGGTAGNIAYNLSLLKTPVGIVGMAGVDFTEYAQFLVKAGVDISKIQTAQNNLTSSAFIMTDKVDNQISAFYPGAMDYASQLSLKGITTDFVVISPNNPQAMVKLTQQCQSLKIPYMLDPGMQLPALSPGDLREMLTGAEILIGNDYEIALLKEKLMLDDEQLLNQVKILITTLGEKGSTIQTGKTISTSGESKPTPEVSLPGRWSIKAGKLNQVVDPTGAGDAYRAGFLTGFTKDLDLKVCAQMGSIAACYAIEKYGTTNHTFTIEEFRKRYQENFGGELKLP
ncbi:carbohydrate kinase family protein [Candidatus Daviesbacteria bacterium]|nr:carbohydrate kinase family protein [Candidatus Daviesbacteria bacterium]